MTTWTRFFQVDKPLYQTKYMTTWARFLQVCGTFVQNQIYDHVGEIPPGLSIRNPDQVGLPVSFQLWTFYLDHDNFLFEFGPFDADPAYLPGNPQPANNSGSGQRNYYFYKKSLIF